MTTIETIRDLYGHQEWADAEHWRAVLACPAACSDRVIQERLHHIHLVQRGFYAIASGTPFAMTEAKDFETPLALLQYAREYYDLLRPFIASLTSHQLDAMVDVPWFKADRQFLTRGQALLQCAMHSQYHRGQNATRLRELGGEPPLTDLILWYWKGKPVVALPRAEPAG